MKKDNIPQLKDENITDDAIKILQTENYNIHLYLSNKQDLEKYLMR